MQDNSNARARSSASRRWLSRSLQAVAGLLLAVLSLWAVAVLYVDTPVAWLRLPLAVGYALAALAAAVLIRHRGRRATVLLGGFGAVLLAWLALPPANDRSWQADVARTAWAEIDGDRVTLHNVRNFDYRAEADYTPRWETRTVDLSQIAGVDVFVTYWGSPWIAHPIVSFGFADGGQLAISIEARKEIGESYSAVLGFFRQYELIYVVADERDAVRLRTSYRQGEEVYLYRIRIAPRRARAIFLSYLERINALHRRPQFYHALTSNCTTNIRLHTLATAEGAGPPWDWRLLLNGKADELLYRRGQLMGDERPFADLKRDAYINDKARAADGMADFSQRIRR